MADITMSLDDTLELDAVIKEWNDPSNIVEDSDGKFNLSGIQTSTRILDPQESGTHTIKVNGQELTVKVTDPSTIPDIGDYQWYIDAGSGSTLDANVGNVTATTSGSPTWVSDSTAVGGQHLSHDGTDDYWQTDSGVLTTPFSVGGWVRFDDMTAFDNGIAANNSDWYVDSDGDGSLLTVSSSGSQIRGQSFPTTGNWGFFAFNAQSDQQRLITWSNSQELADTTDNTGFSESGDTLFVGTHHNSGNLSGDTDFYVVSEGSLLSKSEWTDFWQATQR